MGSLVRKGSKEERVGIVIQIKTFVFSYNVKRLKNFETFFKEIFKSLSDIVEEENAPKEIVHVWRDKIKKWCSLVKTQWNFEDILQISERFQDPNDHELRYESYNYETDNVEICYSGNYFGQRATLYIKEPRNDLPTLTF